MRIVTKSGDQGQTSLIGGQRVYKNDQHLIACGTIDELSAILGVCLSFQMPKPWSEELEEVQRTLFLVAADLASPQSPQKFYLAQPHIDNLELKLQGYLRELPEQNGFVLNGGSQCGALLHWARTVCRRAERECVALKQETEAKQEVFNNRIIVYINRLSDYLFVTARLVNKMQGCEEKKV